MSELSARVKQIKPSPTLAVSAKANALRAAGVDVINLSVGEPDFDTPEFVKAAAIDAIHAGQTKYTAVDGTAELKAAIIQKLDQDNQLQYQPEEIIVSSGAKQSLYNLFQALLGPGDEVIIPAPYWVSYPAMAQLAEATPVVVNSTAETQFKLKPEALAAAITPCSKLFVLNSPSNPTGKAYTKAELHALAEVLQAYPQLWIVCDDIYEHTLWAHPFVHLLTVCPALRERTLVINGVSKAYAMTGWRIGYTAGPSAVVTAMRNIQSQSTSNPNSIAQAAATAALTGPQDARKTMCQIFADRHQGLVTALNTLPGVQCQPSDGTFYAFPDVTQAINTLQLEDDIALAEYLLEHAHVATVPGTAFGMPGHLRLSFAANETALDTAVKRLKTALFGTA